MATFEIITQSECSLSLKFGSSIDEEILTRLIAVHHEINKKPFPGFIESVPTYTSLTIYYDPVMVMRSTLAGHTPSEKVKAYFRKYEWKGFLKSSVEKIIPIPVCYDKSFGLDLEELATELQLNIHDIVQLHSQKIYTVYMVGFTPGFPYMGTTHSKLSCSRKQTPRKQVAAGSVGMAGKQTGIYPSATPGGWQIIGRTPIKLFSVDKNPPAFLQPGDKVKFNSISLEEFNSLNDL